MPAQTFEEPAPRTFQMPCPLCGRALWFTMDETRPVHAEPMCERFAAMSDVEFLGFFTRWLDAQLCSCGEGDA